MVARKIPAKALRTNLVRFVGWRLLGVGVVLAHHMAELHPAAWVLSVANLAFFALIDRGYRLGKVACGAVLAMWLLDIAVATFVLHRRNQGRDSPNAALWHRGVVIVALSALLGFLLEPLLPAVPPRVVRNQLAALAEWTSQGPADACDPTVERCVTSGKPLWRDNGQW